MRNTIFALLFFLAIHSAGADDSPPIPYNPAAQSFVQLADAAQFLSQNDPSMRAAGLSSGAYSRICVSVTFRHIHMALNAMRAHPAALDNAVTSLKAIVSEAHEVAVAHNLDNTDATKGIYVWVLLEPSESDIAKRRGLKAGMLNMERGPNDAAIDAAMAAPAKTILQAEVVVNMGRSLGSQHHAIAILGIDRANKLISYSDPIDPNRILVEPYWIDAGDTKVQLRFRNAMDMVGYIQEAWKVELAY